MSWKIEIDLSSSNEVNAPPPRKDGVYKVRLGRSELTTTSSGKQRVRWTSEVIEDLTHNGEFMGAVVWDGILVPNTGVEKSDRFFRALWFTLGRSLGIPAAKMRKLGTLSPKLIEGKEMHIKYIAPKMKGAYSDVTHLLPNQVETTVHAMALNSTGTEDLVHDADIEIDTGSVDIVPPAAPSSDELDDLFV